MKFASAKRFTALVRRLTTDPKIPDLRWVAYMLATVKHETAGTFAPIAEYGRGKDQPYGIPDLNGRIYYGRGYVQLTWKENYAKLGKQLGLGDALVENPDLALDPDIAYRILSHGMRNGSFTGRKLADYISGSRCNYVGARRIINGDDKAALIASYAADFVNELAKGVPHVRA